MSTFINVHTIENVNAGGVGGKKSQNHVNVVCERPLSRMIKNKRKSTSKDSKYGDKIYEKTHCILTYQYFSLTMM